MTQKRSMNALVAVVCLLFVFGCGGDDGGPNPVTGVDMTPDDADVEIGHSEELTVKVSGGDTKALDWYVNDVLNGNDTFGRISQNSPVTYTAPNSLPSPTTVVVKAISREDTSKMDICRMHLKFTKLFVDSTNGDDDTATGCINLPFRTITKAIAEATSIKTILVRPGTYSDAAGEVFPMYIRTEVSLVGEDWETCIIRKETTEFDGYTGIRVSGDDATVRKFTLRDGAPPGNTRWDSSIYTDRINTLIDSMRIFERAVMSCVRIDKAHDAIVQNCVIDVEMDPTGSKIMNRGFEIVFGDQGTIVRNCRVAGHHTALFFNGSSDASVEDCVLENNTFGAYLCCGSSSTSNPNPDFGGGARGSTGGNSFWNNSTCGLSNLGTSTIYAKFNSWHNDPPVADEDYCNEGTGSIVVD